MINFSNVTQVVIPEGEVKRINVGSTVLWEKSEEIVLPTRDATGEINVTQKTIIECHSKSIYIGMEADAKNCIVLRLENSSTDGIITEATANDTDSSCTVKYYDASSGTIKSKSASIEPYHELGSGVVTGFIVSVTGVTTNGATICFDGDYYWGWDK